MISILELVQPNRGTPRVPYVANRGAGVINPNSLTRGKMPVRRASLSQALPSTPNLKAGFDKARETKTVSVFGTPRMSTSGFRAAGMKPPPGTAHAGANVPMIRR